MPPMSLLVRILLPIVGIGVVVGAVVFLVASAPADWRSPGELALYAAAASVIIACASALWRRYNWHLPVRQLERAAGQMARGDWNVRVEPRGPEGVRRMAGNLNALAAQAQKQLADLQQQRAGLQTLVDTMPDPILAADSGGKIILLNVPAARLLSLLPEQAIGQKLVSVVNVEQIVELYETLAAVRISIRTQATLNREIRLARGTQRYTYQAVATQTTGGGVLLVLRDVSTLAGAVQMKTDFVANASHELRTPIAAIKVAFETLRDVHGEDPAQSERCIAVIDGHLRRLEEMLRDLLDLSRVESPDLKPHVASVKTADLLSAVRSALGTAARAKNVELNLGETPGPDEIRTDSRLFNLILKNLVENSIKFTPSGGKVTVTVGQNPPGDDPPRSVNVMVSDTGIGIAPEHIDRVFERFYQVDTARSGSAGRGTGLGLAIVKHAVNALGGAVKIESTVGAGTRVSCEFPQTEEGEQDAE